jgi:general secretion pathway protein D
VRELRLRLLIAGLSMTLAILIGLGSYDMAHADVASNAAATANTGPVAPAGIPAPPATPDSDADDTNDDTTADTGATPVKPEAAQPQTNTPAAPQLPPVPHPQTNTPTAAQLPPVPQPHPQTNTPAALQLPSVPPRMQRTPVPPVAAQQRQSAPPPPPPPTVQQTPPPEQATIDFEFQAAPITAVLEWYSRLTNRSIISDTKTTAQITFRSQTKLTKDEAIQALDSVLAINNIAAIPLGDKFLKIVAINTAKQEGVPVGRLVAPADTLETQIIPLKNAKAAEVTPILQPYLHPYGQLLPLQDSNSILITETAGNLKQMMEIVAYVDQPSTLRMEMRSYVLVHAKAADVMARLQTIIQETEQAGAHAATGGGQPPPPPSAFRRTVPAPGGQAGAAAGEESVVEGKVIMAADDRTNKLFILTRLSNFAFFDKLIAELDAKVEPDVVMRVIELNYAAAEDVAGLLNALITGGSAPTSTRRTTSSTGTTTTGARAPSVPPPPISGGGGGGVANTGFLQYAEGVHILPDPRTNCLLVMATKEDMARIQELVKDIDTSVAQVQIEVVIAELTLNNELDVGVDLFNRLSSAANGQVVGTGGNSTDGNTPVQLSPLSAIASNLPTAAALASGAGGLTYFTTFKNLNLDTVVHALASTSNSKVLSTPVIQTMDNQEADITVGESVPVPTSQTSSLISGIGTLATAGVTSSIQYEDVAIELKVTPRINPDGYVRMDVEQKVNDLGANVNIGGTIVPTILKREAKSSLAVQDKSTIVLGGLIQATKTVTTTKVPFLGDIPFFGQLFKGQTNNRQRTELIIFIRPSVLRTDQAAVLEARRRLRLLGVSEELERNYFGFPTDTNAPSNKIRGGPVSVDPDSTAPATTPTEDSTDQQSDKVKALKLQDGDITAQ